MIEFGWNNDCARADGDGAAPGPAPIPRPVFCCCERGEVVMGVYYIDGDYVREEEATLPVTDMAVLRG